MEVRELEIDGVVRRKWELRMAWRYERMNQLPLAMSSGPFERPRVVGQSHGPHQFAYAREENSC